MWSVLLLLPVVYGQGPGGVVAPTTPSTKHDKYVLETLGQYFNALDANVLKEQGWMDDLKIGFQQKYTTPGEFNGTFMDLLQDQDNILHEELVKYNKDRITAEGLLRKNSNSELDSYWMSELDRLQGDMKNFGKELDDLYEEKKNAATNSVLKMEGIEQGIMASMDDTSAVVEKSYALANKRMMKQRAAVRKAAKTNAAWWEEEEDMEQETSKILRDQAAHAQMSMESLKDKARADVNLVKSMATKMQQWIDLLKQTRQTSIVMMLPLTLLKHRRMAEKGLTKKLDRVTKEAQKAWAKLQKVVDSYDTQVSNSFTDWRQGLWKQAIRDNKLLGRLRNDVLSTTTKSDTYTEEASANLRKVESAFDEDLSAYKTAVQQVKDSVLATTTKLKNELLKEDAGHVSLASTERYNVVRQLMEQLFREKTKGMHILKENERSVQTDYNLLTQDALDMHLLKSSYDVNSHVALSSWQQKEQNFEREIEALRSGSQTVKGNITMWREKVMKDLSEMKVELSEQINGMQYEMQNKLNEMEPFPVNLAKTGREQATAIEDKMFTVLSNMKDQEEQKRSEDATKEADVHSKSQQFTGEVISAMGLARELATRATSLQNSKLTHLLVSVGDITSKTENALQTGRDEIRENVTALTAKSEEAVTKAALSFEEKAQTMVRMLGKKLRKEGRGISSEGSRWFANAKERGAQLERQALDLKNDAKKTDKSAYEQALSIEQRERRALELIQAAGSESFARNVVGVRSNAQFGADLAATRDAIRNAVDEMSRKQIDKSQSLTQQIRDQGQANATKVTHGVGQQTAKLVAHSMKTFDTVLKQVRGVENDVQGFTADMQGKARNETEWYKKIAKRAQSSATVAQNLALTQARNALEQEALIDEKFRTVQAAVSEDVHNLGVQQQDMITALTTKAKDAAKHLVKNSGLKGEALAARLNKVDQWLSSQVSHIASTAEKAEGKLGAIDEAARDFDGETTERLDSLHTMLAADPALEKVAEDIATVKHTGLGLDQVIENGKTAAGELKTDMTEKHALTAKSHRAEGNETTAMLRAASMELSAAVRDAEIGINEAIGQATADMQGNGAALPQAVGRMQRAERSWEAMNLNIAERVHGLPHEREDKLGNVNAALLRTREAFQNIGQKVVDNLILWDQTSKDFFGKQYSDQSSWEQRFRELMKSTNLALLQELSGVDQQAVGMQEDQDKRWNEIQSYIKADSDWRAQVEKHLKALKDEMGEEIEGAEKTAAGFGAALDADAAKDLAEEESRVNSSLGGAMNTINGAIGQSALGLSPEAVQGIMGSDNAAADAEASYAASMGPIQEGQAGQQQQMGQFDDMLERLTGKFGMAESVGNTLQQAQQAAVEKKRQEALGALNGLSSFAQLTSGLGHGELLESVARTLGAHAHLKARHAELASRINQLRAESGAGTQPAAI